MERKALGRYFNITKRLLDDRLEQGLADGIAYRCYNPGQARTETTYKELAALVNQLGNGLRKLGIQPEQRVAILQNDSIEAVVSLLGAIRIGAIPIFLNTMLKRDKLRFILEDSRAACLIVERQFLADLQEDLPTLPHLKYLVVRGADKPGQVDFEELLSASSSALDPFNSFRDEIALWQYTSGTTGEPKGVMHTHRQIAFSASTFFNEILNLSSEDLSYCVSKLFFGYGQGNSVWGPLWHGASVVLFPGRPTPEKVVELVQTCRPTILFAAPTHYSKILHTPDLANFDSSSLRLCISAGEALPSTICDEWRERYGLEVLDGIGSTEAFHVFIANRIGQVRPGSSGKLLSGYEAKILRRDGKAVPVGKEGVLHVKGGSIATGYWNNYEKTKATFLGEWLNTSDIYRIDKDGYYWHCGRADDLFKTGGVWVSPIEVENALREHGAVMDAGVVPFVNPEKLQKAMAYVVLKAGHVGCEELVKQLKDFVKTKLEPYKRPEVVEFVDKLPRTTTGKIQRNALKERAKAHHQ